MSQFYGDTFEMETAAETVLMTFSAGRGEGIGPQVSKGMERALVPQETRQ
jgi:hypothetical protein